MAKPWITYNHGFLDDCTDDTVGDWSETESGLAATLTAEHDDYFQIACVCDNVADEYAYYDYTFSSSLSSSVFKRCLVRWKTNVANNGVGLKVALHYTNDGGGYDYVVGSASAPAFSNRWTVTNCTLPSDRTYDSIRITVDDSPDTIASGTYYVYLDFILIVQGTFSFPNVKYGMEVTLPPRYAFLKPPGYGGDIVQSMGSNRAIVTCSCDLDEGDWTLSTGYTTKAGEVFWDIAQNTYRQPWQWLSTGTEQFKVVLENMSFQRLGDRHILDLTFGEYRRSSANAMETYLTRFGLNL